MEAFDKAFAAVIGHEGGYVNHPNDPGSETNFGISKSAYPDENIGGMTLERAKAIYRRDYWDTLRCDELPERIALQVFDAGVNHGRSMAVRFLQKAVGVEQDGIIGPRTIHASRVAREDVVHALFNAARLEAYTRLPTWGTFGKGWVRRIVENLREPYTG